jgi:Fur family ferric uptake transcriptional regulator
VERSTRQRTAIAQALAAVGQPLLPQELLVEAQKSVPSLSLATVYRNLKGLVEDGVVDVVTLPGEATRYESHRHHHHHHFHCSHCQKVFDIDACPGDLGHLLPNGYVLDSHELTFYGRCAGCAGCAA